MSVELHNKECIILNAKYGTYTILGIAFFSIYVGMVEILWRSMAQGIWI
jgi:hypothetical protein